MRLAYPWGSDLLPDDGPEPWALEVGDAIRHDLESRPGMPSLNAVSSGHGIGKTAGLAMLCDWGLSTAIDARCRITANTATQLQTIVMPEIAKWRALSLTADWFETAATSVQSVEKDHRMNWRADAVPWSKERPAAFAGLHNAKKRILFLIDEGSEVPDIIYETMQGALTDADTEIVVFVPGNPTQGTGYFRDMFGRFSSQWNTWKVDARTVRRTNKKLHETWAKLYGEDSDYFRVRVKGEFPSVGNSQFIGYDLIQAARAREPSEGVPGVPTVLGIDVARFGDDASRIVWRRGRDARTVPSEEYRGLDMVALARATQALAKRIRPDAIFIDGGGVGGGFVDVLRTLMPTSAIFDVLFGGKPRQTKRYFNRRAEMYGDLREWLETGCIEDDDQLERELAAIRYGFAKENLIQLERKPDLKAREGMSPDWADALALTFAEEVTIEPDRLAPGLASLANDVADWDPLETV